MRDNGDDAFGAPLDRTDRPIHISLPSSTTLTPSTSTVRTSSLVEPTSLPSSTPLDNFLQAVHQALNSGLSKQTLIANIHLIADERVESTEPSFSDDFSQWISAINWLNWLVDWLQFQRSWPFWHWSLFPLDRLICQLTYLGHEVDNLLRFKMLMSLVFCLHSFRQVNILKLVHAWHRSFVLLVPLPFLKLVFNCSHLHPTFSSQFNRWHHFQIHFHFSFSVCIRKFLPQWHPLFVLHSKSQCSVRFMPIAALDFIDKLFRTTFLQLQCSSLNQLIVFMVQFLHFSCSFIPWSVDHSLHNCDLLYLRHKPWGSISHSRILHIFISSHFVLPSAVVHPSHISIRNFHCGRLCIAFFWPFFQISATIRFEFNFKFQFQFWQIHLESIRPVPIGHSVILDVDELTSCWHLALLALHLEIHWSIDHAGPRFWIGQPSWPIATTSTCDPPASHSSLPSWAEPIGQFDSGTGHCQSLALVQQNNRNIFQIAFAACPLGRFVVFNYAKRDDSSVVGNRRICSCFLSTFVPFTDKCWFSTSLLIMPGGWKLSVDTVAITEDHRRLLRGDTPTHAGRDPCF